MDDTNRKSTLSSGTTYRFGLFTLDVSAGSLTRNGVRVKLQDQPFQLLALLVERSGEIVTREEIRQRLWESNTFVDFDKSLGVAVLKVREALGDSATNPRFLETAPRRGYRFIAPVSVEALRAARIPAQVSPLRMLRSPNRLAIDSMAAPEAPSRHAETFTKRRRRLWYIAAAICAAIALRSSLFASAFTRQRLKRRRRQPPSNSSCGALSPCWASGIWREGPTRAGFRPLSQRCSIQS
jgi:DNA-binding winged helix-turn-helix (wHTH) protein